MGYLSTATVLLDFQHWLMDKEVDCSAQAVFITELALVVRKVKLSVFRKNGDVQQVKMVSGKKSIYVLCWMQRRIAASCSIVLITVILFYVEMLIR